MNKQGTYVPYYKDPPSYAPVGIQYQVVDPSIAITGAPANKSVLLQVPPGSGFWIDSRLKFTYGTGAIVAAEINALASVHNIRDFSIEVSGQPIVYKTKRDILQNISDLEDEGLKSHIYRYAQMLDPTTEKVATAGGAQTVVSYLPMLESFFTKPERQLLLNAVNDVYIRINFDSTEASGLANALTSMEVRMETWTYMPQLSTFNEIVEKNWSQKFMFQMSNCHSEQFPLTSTELTTKTFTLGCPFYVNKMYIDLQQNNNDVVNGSLGLPYHDIQSITVNIGGLPFFSSVKPSALQYYAAKAGKSSVKVVSNTSISYSDTGRIIINWDVLRKRYMDTGGVFLQSLKGTTVTITYGALTAAQAVLHTAYVGYNYFQGVEYEPSLGGGNLKVMTNN